ncbi:MAG: MFS transporter [Elusimicrobiales bacterium]
MTDAEEKRELSFAENIKILTGASRGFWLSNLANFGDGIAYFGILTLLTRFLGTRVGMDDRMTGLSVSMFTGLVTLFMLGCGFLTDRLGVRRALTFALAFLLGGRILITLAPSLSAGTSAAFMTAWAGLILMAFGSGVLQPTVYAGPKEYADPRTAAIGYSLVYAIMNLGIVFANFLSPYVRTSDTFIKIGSLKINGLGWDIDGVFMVCTVVTAVMLITNMLLFTKTVEQTQRICPADHKPDHRPWTEKIKELPFMDARFMAFIFVLLPVRTLFAHQWLTMPDYVFRAYPAEVGAKFEWISGLNPLIIVVFVPLITAFTRKARIINMMIIGTAISALTTFILSPGPNLAALIAYTILFSLGEAVWSSRFLEYVASIAPFGKVGAYMGLAGIPWFLAKFTTGLYSGSMLEIFVPAHGYQSTGAMWTIYGFFACVSPVGLILLRNWLMPKHAPACPAPGQKTPVEA